MNLTYGDSVKKTQAIERSVALLDPYFDGEPSIITSGWRSPQDQARIILDKAKQHNIALEFSEFTHLNMKDIEVKLFVQGIEKPVFWWQRTWSRLLNIGDIVNPPVAAEVLFDYFRPGNLENKKGQIIQPSPHQRGIAFDIGGGTNLTEKAKRVMYAKQEGKAYLSNFLIEKINNAVHCDVEEV